MVREYELMYIVRPELDDEALQAATASVEQLITAAGGSVTHSTSWGRRRLAYEVKHLRDGHYMLLQLRLDGAQVGAIERALTISETVFRHLLVVQELPVAAEAAAENGATAPVADEPVSESVSQPASDAVVADARQAAVAEAGEDVEQDGVADSGAGDEDEDDVAAVAVAAAPDAVEEN